MEQSKSYFMDHPREARRLAEKVDAAAWVARYLAPYLRDGHEILDVGCGPGTIATEVARICPHSQVIGIDLYRDRFAREEGAPATRSNVSLQCGDASDLELPGDHFDLVYCRFLLEYLADREKAVREMVRVCKPGGHILLQDLDGQLLWHYPPDEKLEVMLGRVIKGLSRTGFDPLVGRKLYSLVQKTGLSDIHVDVEGYHVLAGRIDEHNLRLWELKLDIALPTVADVLRGTEAAAKLKSRFLDYLRREDTLTYSVLFTVVGAKPES